MVETFLEVECNTWSKDTHGLFDYDSSSYTTSKFVIWDSGLISRLFSTCKFTQFLNTLQITSPEERLIELRRKHDRFFLLSTESSSLWAVSKLTYGNEGYSLKEGDTVKLGRVLLRVKTISKGNQPVIPSSDKLYCEDLSVRENDATCRICCCEQETDENPLIVPCKCTGSVKYIHVDCIKKWLESKINCRSTNRVSTYHWSDLSCEICKSPLPHTVKYNDKNFDLFIIKFPSTPYIVLEDCKSEEGTQTMHLVDLQNDHSIMIGRGHDCDIRLGDISVSRKHAKILIEEGSFRIKDCGSKFGTLIKIAKDFVLEKDKLVAIQVNKTVVKFRCKVKSTCWVYCCESDSPKYRRNPEWPGTDPHSPQRQD